MAPTLVIPNRVIQEETIWRSGTGWL